MFPAGLDKIHPTQQRQQEKNAHQNIFALGNPRDRFDLHRMNAENRRRQPGARHTQSCQ
jgi:hypothetical protein